MPTGRVKVFFDDRKYGFIISDEGGEIHVAADAVEGGQLAVGDEVEFEVAETDDGQRTAAGVRVTRAAPAANPVGRTMAPPPSWEELEERERQRRMARRRRR